MALRIRKVLCRIMLDLGISAKLVYSTTQIRIKSNLTEAFETNVGINQGAGCIVSYLKQH